MAEGARAQVAADRKRLQEILAEQQRKQVSEKSSSHSCAYDHHHTLRPSKRLTLSGLIPSH
jgi:hypothetical protein